MKSRSSLDKTWSIGEKFPERNGAVCDCEFESNLPNEMVESSLLHQSLPDEMVGSANQFSETKWWNLLIFTPAEIVSFVSSFTVVSRRNGSINESIFPDEFFWTKSCPFCSSLHRSSNDKFDLFFRNFLLSFLLFLCFCFSDDRSNRGLTKIQKTHFLTVICYIRENKGKNE